MAAPPRGSHLYFEFGKAGNLDVIHAVVDSEGPVAARYAFTAIELTERGPQRAITPKKKGGLASDLIYRFQGDALVIEEGECSIRDVNAQRDYKVSLKGEWKRVSPELEKLHASWRPVKPIRGTDIQLEFRNDILEVACRFPNELGMGPVEQRWFLVELMRVVNKRGMVPANLGTGLSRITYRVNGDTLVIDQGEYTVEGRTISLKGEWNRDKRNRLP